METIETIAALRERVRSFRTAQGRSASVGFVPTMGYLHEGHASLLRQARKECGLVVLSIFVNPLQFGPNEDFERYPRDTDRDLGIAADAGADLVFLPGVREMYPSWPMHTKVTVGGLTDVLCGASRPGHFDGVATVVSKLFHIVEPDRAYFGMKDAQQVAVIRRMADELNMPVTVVACPTVRESDGLAKSSRNVYLSPEERAQAVVLSRTLDLAERLLRDGAEAEAESVGLLKLRLRREIETAPLAEIDYVEILTYPSLQPPERLRQAAPQGDRELLVALAVKFGSTRLIDNRLIPLA